MTEIVVRGVHVTFPFKPYKVQEDYMNKVVECLQDGKHGALESPTGTGKTLCLLCSSLAWLHVKKAQIQAQMSVGAMGQMDAKPLVPVNDIMLKLQKAGGSNVVGPSNTFGNAWTNSMPKIIYASRTHSQLSQAMQELKRTSYKNVKVTVLGSRDQLCINPDVSRETNAFNKIHRCQAKVKARTCQYYNNVETRKDFPVFRENILDIEDLVKAGNKNACCPYYLTRELKQSADIIFMPYNYLLDPKTRKNQGIDLGNNVILLDEAHNIEKTCEEAASLEISSTDIAVCIDEITTVMQHLVDNQDDEDLNHFDTGNSREKDFTTEDLCLLKTMFLEIEKIIDSIELRKKDEGETFPGAYVLELLSKAGITHGKDQLVVDKLEKIITFLTTLNPTAFNKKGNGLQKFCDFLKIVFVGGLSHMRYRDKIEKCYKVYIQSEGLKKTFKNDVWESKKITKSEGKSISYWCFSPGFGMQQLVDQGVRSVILTSGTLSPMKPFISELGIPIAVQLENPHIVESNQVCIGVLGQGPDGHPLNSSYNTRNDPKYISSLGQTIFNFSCLLPHGLLVFFPSYPIMKKCRDDWQSSGVWSKIAERKPVYVEPQSKDTFVSIMNEYYQKINDPSGKGAIFMAVCRGKISEGLDFADANGRAVLITGLPFPPLKDARVVLKQKYLDENKRSGNESLSGQQWYQLEASKAVNQAIGRIIRHKSDYGAIILCDCRFDNASFKQHLSSWIRPQIKKYANFGVVTRELRQFFKTAELHYPQKIKNSSSLGELSLPAVHPALDTSSRKVYKPVAPAQVKLSKPIEPSREFPDINDYLMNRKTDTSPAEIKGKNLGSLCESRPKNVINFSNCKLDRTQSTINKIQPNVVKEPVTKKRKIKMEPIRVNFDANVASTAAQNFSNSTDDKSELGRIYLKQVKQSLSESDFKSFAQQIRDYSKSGDFNALYLQLERLFMVDRQIKDLFLGIRTFLKKHHKSIFDEKVETIAELGIW